MMPTHPATIRAPRPRRAHVVEHRQATDRSEPGPGRRVA